MLCFTLFTHLLTTKFATFKMIISYNDNFKIKIDKQSSLSNNLPINLQLMAYQHEIKVTYPDFVAAQQFSSQIKIPQLSVVIVKLEHSRRQVRVVEPRTLSMLSNNNKKNIIKVCPKLDKKNCSSTLGLKKNKEKCEHYDSNIIIMTLIRKIILTKHYHGRIKMAPAN